MIIYGDDQALYDTTEYPPVGKIAVTATSRIIVMQNESCNEACFTGMLLRSAPNPAKRMSRDVSTLWLRSHIINIQDFTAADYFATGLDLKGILP